MQSMQLKLPKGRRTGSFWPMHEMLFANQAALDDESLAEYAAALGLNAKRLIQEVISGAHAQRSTKILRAECAPESTARHLSSSMVDVMTERAHLNRCSPRSRSQQELLNDQSN